jgi:hypothetical protein
MPVQQFEKCHRCRHVWTLFEQDGDTRTCPKALDGCETVYELGPEQTLCPVCGPMRYWWDTEWQVATCYCGKCYARTPKTESTSDRLRALVTAAGVPAVVARSLARGRPNETESLRAVTERPKGGLLLAGPKDSGKTTAACWALWVAAKQADEAHWRGTSGAYVAAPALARQSRLSAADFERLVKPRLLVVDRVGEGRDARGYQAELLLEVLRDRAAEDRDTILVADFAPEELGQRLLAGGPEGAEARNDLWTCLCELRDTKRWRLVGRLWAGHLQAVADPQPEAQP